MLLLDKKKAKIGNKMIHGLFFIHVNKIIRGFILIRGLFLIRLCYEHTFKNKGTA